MYPDVFCLPRSFRRRLRNDLRGEQLWSFLSSLLLAEPRAHLLLLYLTYFCCNRYKNETKKETLSSDTQKTRKTNKYPPRSFRRRLRNDLSISQLSSSSLDGKTERARTFFFPRTHLSLSRVFLSREGERYKKKRERRNETHTHAQTQKKESSSESLASLHGSSKGAPSRRRAFPIFLISVP